MKNTITKVGTWLPVFSGFYGTIWETDHDEESEMVYINEKREAKGLEPAEWDDFKWDYEGYRQDVCKGVTRHIEYELKRLGLVTSMKFEKLVSPREYNFTNDSVDVAVELTEANESAIVAYLTKNEGAFDIYILDTYSSRSGFISSHPHDAEEWRSDIEETLTHSHRLGAVLNFILRNEDEELEMKVWEDLTGNGTTLQASNFEELTGE